MTKFWTGVGLILLIGLIATFSATIQSTSNVMVYDLETECRGDRDTSSSIVLQPDDTLRLKGYFPVENTKSNMRYQYSGGNNIVLNVESEKKPAPEFLWYDCLASGVYDIQTPRLEEGRYSIEIRHNGERVEKRILGIK